MSVSHQNTFFYFIRNEPVDLQGLDFWCSWTAISSHLFVCCCGFDEQDENVAKNLIIGSNHPYPAEHGKFKEANKRTVAKAKAIQSSETTASQQPRDEQSFEAVKTATSKSLHKYYFILWVLYFNNF